MEGEAEGEVEVESDGGRYPWLNGKERVREDIR